MSLTRLRLKKGEIRRLRSGHPWIFSNEIDVAVSPLKSFSPGQEVLVEASDQTILGVAYINPHSLIAGRLFSYDPNQRLNTEWMIKRIQEALNLRERLFDQPFYRLVFGESDGLPGLIIDRFGQHFVVQINTAGIEAKKACIPAALRSIFPDIQSILLKNDSGIRKAEGLNLYSESLLGDPPEFVELKENGLLFLAPLRKGQKTGWFFDHRLSRARLKSYVKQQRVLDVFSYLGGWGIQAAAHGARSVTFIESSAAAAAYLEKNAALNHLTEKTTVICDDAFQALKKLIQENMSFDVIILDPPAFVKKRKDIKEGTIAYQRLNEMALKLLTPGGILISCSCSMHVSESDFLQIITRASYRTQSAVQLLEQGHQGPDHPIHLAIPETDYLKTLFIRKLN